MKWIIISLIEVGQWFQLEGCDVAALELSRQFCTVACIECRECVERNGFFCVCPLEQVPMGCQYWKNNKSILPAVQEDGIVGLTFSPSGEHFCP